ncbi:MAG TPA: site-2 protease family protein [Pseudoclavibacter sp.]|nr:site-2 protease family protein [Pseudoclavibacter sp.]
MSSVVMFLLGVIVVVLGIAVSVGVHEFGHLLAAKAFGIKVTKYFIGFGPTIWSHRWGETEYGLKWIPLGGFCSIAGMYPSANEPASRASTDADPASDPTSDAPAAERRGVATAVAANALDMGEPELAPGEEHRAFYRAPIWQRLCVMLGGIMGNVLLTIVFFSASMMGIGVAELTPQLSSVSQCVLPETSSQTTCTDDDALSPGAEAGLQPGDTILSIDGTAISSWDEVTAAFQDSAGVALDLVIERDGEQLSVTVSPIATLRYVYAEDGSVQTDADGTALTHTVGFVGVSPSTEFVPQSFGTVLSTTWDYAGQVAAAVVTLPEKVVGVVESMLTDEERSTDSPLSVVGVGRVAGEVASSSALSFEAKAATVLSLLGALNLSLAMFNVIPLLPLDGGHAAGAIWEGIRRGWARMRRRPDPGPFDASRLLPVTTVVTVLLLVMGGVLILSDVFDPISLFG